MLRNTRLLVVQLIFFLTAAIANAQVDLVIPRLGEIQGRFPAGSLIVLADNDEGLFIEDVPEDAVFGSPLSVLDDGFLGSIGVALPSGGLSTTPGSLDAGDYAFAVGLLVPRTLNPVTSYRLESFFQLRLAGSSAVALTDTAGVLTSEENNNLRDILLLGAGSFAQLAVNEGVWTSPDDYIEFDPGNALVFPRVASPSGPGDWSQSVLPEPTSAVLAVLAAIAATGGGRLRA